jgi:hypothetical protein
MNIDKIRRRSRAEQMRKYLLSGGPITGPGVVRMADYKPRKARQAIRESIALALMSEHPRERAK